MTLIDQISDDAGVVSQALVYLIAFAFQYTVVPTRRSSAEALQILFCHLLGDAGSPYLIGVVS